MVEQKAVVSPLIIKIVGISFTIFGCIGLLVMVFSLIMGKGASFVMLMPLIILIGGIILMAMSSVLDNQKILYKKLDSLSKE